MISALRNLAADDSGGALIEYALVAALVSLVGFAALQSFGIVLSSFYTSSASNLSNMAVDAK
jgi:Flp pilus assembly pilin Flp